MASWYLFCFGTRLDSSKRGGLRRVCFSNFISSLSWSPRKTLKGGGGSKKIITQSRGSVALVISSVTMTPSFQNPLLSALLNSENCGDPQSLRPPIWSLKRSRWAGLSRLMSSVFSLRNAQIRVMANFWGTYAQRTWPY